MLLLLLGGCTGLTYTGGEDRWVCRTRLTPRQAAHLAATVLAARVPTHKAWHQVPALRRSGDRWLLEARARTGRLYRWRRGGVFTTPPVDPARSARSNHRTGVEDFPPLPLADRVWMPTAGGPFPLFFEARVRLTIHRDLAGGSTLELVWTDTEGEPVGPGVRRALVTLLPLAEALAEGTRRLRHGDPIGALAAYDRARSGAPPPGPPQWTALRARLRLNRGLCLVRLGALEAGRHAFAAAGALDRDLEIAPVLEGLTAWRTGQCHTARRTLRTALGRLTPAAGPLAGVVRHALARWGESGDDDGLRLLARGRELLAQGRSAEARRLYLVARTRPDLRTRALRGLAAAERQGGRLREARDHLLQGLALEPGNPALIADLAGVERDRREPGLALFHAVGLGRHTPAFRRALTALGPAGTAARLALTRLGRALDLLPPDLPLTRALATLVTGEGRHLLDLAPRPWRRIGIPAAPPR